MIGTLRSGFTCTKINEEDITWDYITPALHRHKGISPNTYDLLNQSKQEPTVHNVLLLYRTELRRSNLGGERGRGESREMNSKFRMVRIGGFHPLYRHF